MRVAPFVIQSTNQSTEMLTRRMKTLCKFKKKKNQANYDEVKTRLCRVCFVVVVVNVVVVVLIVVAVHKGLVVVDKSLSDTH